MTARAPEFRLPEPPPDLLRRLEAGDAVAWSEPVEVLTYEPAEYDRYPMYFERRVYQGSSGRVYPLPFTDRILPEPVARAWEAIHLENRWIRLMVLPELGGRIHVGVDKIAGYDFFYRNNVIKPALVGLAGPWVSGGVEFNWPQHHRPATFLPVDTRIERDPDGAVTVWCTDHDPFARMRGTHGIRLRPDRAAVELVVRLHNRTSTVQTFLWWANAAVRVHDRYQSFFPTDVHWVADHARRAVTAFPAADRPYYGVDYPARAAIGEDRLDFWKNIPVPTSYMVLDTADDFFGGYDHDARAGFVHVADRRIAPGKKQWTWGNSAFGEAWNALLTDGDGPYIELMSGVFTDNQPDFAWLTPGETREFRQSWYPIQEIGPVHQANDDIAIRLDVSVRRASIGLVVTRRLPSAEIELRVRGERHARWVEDLDPGRPVIRESAIPAVPAHEVEVRVGIAGRELVRWAPPDGSRIPPEPAVAVAPGPPDEIPSVEELVLVGRHLAQYRHPTRSPLPYWLEAIRRDEDNVGARIALAEHRLAAGDYAAAEQHVRAALARLTARNRNPRDGEAFYLLGLSLSRQGRDSEALDAFGKAAWNRPWTAPSMVETARIEARRGRAAAALAAVRQARRLDPDDVRGRVLEIVQLAVVDRAAAAAALKEALAAEPLDLVLGALAGRLPRDPRSVIDAALEIAAAGDRAAALDLLARVDGMPHVAGDVRPLAHYHRARLLDEEGRSDDAAAARAAGRSSHDARCFPWGLDDLDTLIAAREADPADPVARHLLALQLVALGRGDEAAAEWQAAAAAGLDDAVAHRTAAVLAYNRGAPVDHAITGYERAIALRPRDARLWYESDQLLARAGRTAAERRARLDSVRDIVLERDDAATEYAQLLTATGDAEAAIGLLRGRTFAPWEGGEGRVLAAWDAAWGELASRAIDAGEPGRALQLLDAAADVPTNLGEARHPLESSSMLDALRDRALRELGRPPAVARTQVAAGPPPDDFFATSDPDLLLFDRRGSG